MELGRIRELIREGKYYYSGHAKEMMFDRAISERQIINAVVNGEILEKYKDDLRGRSYLILGDGPVHVIAGYNKYTKKAIIVTAYIPEAPKWITPRKRG